MKRIFIAVHRSVLLLLCMALMPICASAETFYATSEGIYHHLDDQCSGMQNASAHSISTANADGKKPCPSCFGESAIWVQLSDGALTAYSSSDAVNTEIFVNNR